MPSSGASSPCWAMRKERDFLYLNLYPTPPLAVKAREERAASRGISTGSGDC